MGGRVIYRSAPMFTARGLARFSTAGAENPLRRGGGAAAARVHSSNSSHSAEQPRLKASSSRGAAELERGGKSWVVSR